MNGRNIIVFAILASFAIAIGSILFYFSWSYLNGMHHISVSTSDWGSFGSFLAGVFSPLSGLTVLVTLYIFQQQNKLQESIFNEQKLKQEEIIEIQKNQAMAEKFHTHKSDFVNSLSSIEENYRGYLKIEGKIKLYQKIFPENGVLNVKEVIEFKPFGDSINGDIERAYFDLMKLDKTLYKASITPSELAGIIISIYDITYHLGIKIDSDVGEVVFNGTNTNFNIFIIDRTFSIIKDIFRYMASMSETKITIPKLTNTMVIKDTFLDIINTKHSSRDGYYMNDDPKLRKVIKCYNFSKSNRKNGFEELFIASKNYIFYYSKRDHDEEDRILNILRKTYHKSMSHEVRKKISASIY